MMVTEQIAALRALGTDPIRKLVLPRMLAGLCMVPLLTVVSSGIGMVGAWIVTVTQLQVASSVYWNSVVAGLYIQDVWMGLIKPFFIGFTIASIGCHVGMRTSGARRCLLPLDDERGSRLGCGHRGDFLVTNLLIALMYEDLSRCPVSLLESRALAAIIVFDDVRWLRDKEILRTKILTR